MAKRQQPLIKVAIKNRARTLSKAIIPGSGVVGTIPPIARLETPLGNGRGCFTLVLCPLGLTVTSSMAIKEV